MAYATIADLLKRYDWRNVGDLILDNGNQADQGTIAADASGIIAAALDTASGEIDSAVMRGQRYTATDLAGLTGHSLALLKSLCCKLAFWNLWERRPSWGDPDQFETTRQQARGVLKELKTGEAIFDIEKVKDAGNISSQSMTRMQVEGLNLMRDRLGKFFPPRFLPGE